MTELAFDCVGARVDPYAAAPGLVLTLRITADSRLDAIALRCQLRIEPHRRRYTPAESSRLADLFGDVSRWGETLKPLQLANVSVMVPGFSGVCDVDLDVPCGYDLEVASGAYFAGLEEGEVPLLLLFSGSVFAVDDGRMRVTQVPWSKEVSYRLPVATWRQMVDTHFPNSGWIRCSRDTIDALRRFKSTRALPTWDATVLALLDSVEERLP